MKFKFINYDSLKTKRIITKRSELSNYLGDTFSLESGELIQIGKNTFEIKEMKIDVINFNTTIMVYLSPYY